jgi:hypothetical protein
MGINEFSRRYKSGDHKKRGQKLDRRIFNGYLMVNSAKRYPHLTVGQHVFIPRQMNGGLDDLVCPATVEVRKQVVNTPLMVAVDNAPLMTLDLANRGPTSTGTHHAHFTHRYTIHAILDAPLPNGA